jgi:hypothetical protein
MNYIGVRGHRGAGKSSIAYLLGNTIEFIEQGNGSIVDKEWFGVMYNKWCDQIMTNQNCINETAHTKVYFESFSDSIKTFIRLLLGCPEDYLYDDKYKDTIIVNLRDLSTRDIYGFSGQLVTSDEMYAKVDKEGGPVAFNSNIYMTLREFIMYFGLEVMQRFFGRNIWVKSLRANSEQLDKFYDTGDSYKIFIDLKTPAEVTYIKQAKGVVVNVNRPSNKKTGSGLERLGRDDRIDYTIDVEGDLYSLKDKIVEVSINIINNFKNILQNGEEREV